MKKLFSLLQVAATALCLTTGIGLSAAEQCGCCQTCDAASHNRGDRTGNDSGFECLTCENIWDGYCASKSKCLSMHCHLLASYQGCCLDNALEGIQGCVGAPCRGHAHGLWQSLKSKFRNPFVYTSYSTGAHHVTTGCVCAAPPDCDCAAPATCDCDAPPPTVGVGESDPDGIARDKPTARYKFEYSPVDPSSEYSKEELPTPPVVPEAPLPAERPYSVLRLEDSSQGKTPNPFNWLKRAFSKE